jgi:shikimate dehydrogenase
MHSISPSTRLVVLLGEPVAHSLSPRFQNAGFAAAGVDGVYVALRCREEDVPGLMVGIARSGGAGNVTLPYKEVAASLVENPTEAAQRTGACNTFWFEGGQICGDNTDVVGFRRALAALLGHSAQGLRVLLLGAGGSARGVLFALLADGAEEVVIVNRSPARATELAARYTSAMTRVTVVSELVEHSRPFDLAVNTTTLGLHPDDPFPLSPQLESQPAAIFDLVYSPDRTPWVRHHLERGIPAADGLEMLLYQGAAAFERWWGMDAPLSAMRAALGRNLEF